ncbi:RP853 family protein [Rickettsia endosymbiont of Gonocerus acuteangulatus]|uniref:RP853 family protein n=1 Tax=Rickettsia endosymbiont of Gonocerus acuteangulatus TaxID=3066266 RepID=UPI00397AA043
MNNIDTNLFKKDIINNFINNLTEITCSTLANMLAIDYEIRLNSKPEAKKYINACISRLKNHLRLRVINDDSFSLALKLFVILITPEGENNQNISEQSQDIVAENLVEMYFGAEKISSEEKLKIKNVFKVLLKEKNFDEIINYAQSYVKLFRTSLRYGINKYKTPNEISVYIQQKFSKVLEISSELTRRSNLFKQTTGKIAGAACALLVGAISVATAGAAFSIVVLPVSIFAVKYAPKIGEKIGELILNNDKAIKLEQNNINQIIAKISNNNENLLSQEKRQNIQKSIITTPTKLNIKLDKKLGHQKHR